MFLKDLHLVFLNVINLSKAYKDLACLFLLVLFCLNAFAQAKQDLEKKRNDLIQQIRKTSNLLRETKKNKEAALDRYVTLRNQINQRKELVKTISLEIAQSDSSIVRTSGVVSALEEDLEVLRADYAEMLRYAYRYKRTNSRVLFIFSSSTFNQAFRRWRYIKQYDRYRQNQANMISSTQKSLAKKIQSIEKRKLEKEALLSSEQKQQTLLSKELQDKNALLKEVQKDVNRLEMQLSEQRNAQQRLAYAIEDVISTDMQTTTTSTTTTIANNSNFKANKGNLPWPVQSGFITGRFGEQPHPTLPKIKIKNNGIDIQVSNNNTKVKAVYAGTVSSISFIPGYNKVVIIKHGEYFTAYSNLKEVYIKQGETIKSDHIIGKAMTDSRTNTTKLHFEIWKNKKRLNPSYWIQKK